VELYPQVDAGRIAANREGRIAAVELVRTCLIDCVGLVVVPICWRLGCECETSGNELAVEMAPYQILEVTSAHYPSRLPPLGLPRPLKLEAV
jgi:hypothetical protein